MRFSLKEEENRTSTYSKTKEIRSMNSKELLQGELKLGLNS